MSAFECSDLHIAFLVLAFRRYVARPGSGITLLSHEIDEMARVLKAENRRSVSHRYPRDNKPCPACGETVCDPRVGYDPSRAATWLLPTPPPVGWRPGVAAPCAFAKVEIPPSDRLSITPVGTIKLAHCYQYQANEHDGWETSKAKQITDRLIDAAIGHLDGYEAAPWSIA